jgi:hypothetical protein
MDEAGRTFSFQAQENGLHLRSTTDFAGGFGDSLGEPNERTHPDVNSTPMPSIIIASSGSEEFSNLEQWIRWIDRLSAMGVNRGVDLWRF